MRGAVPRDPSGGTGAADEPVTVLIVDDQEPFRLAMRDVVAATEGFALISEAASAEEALIAVDDLFPQLVLMDKRMPGMGGIEAARLITSHHTGVVVVIVSVEEPHPQVLHSSGAAAFVRKQKLSSRLIRDTWMQHGR